MKREMKEYKYWCLGFLFNHEKTHVLLIRKDHPERQAGKLNGIGGEVNSEKESSFTAICREFQEETGILYHNFELFAELHGETDIRYQIDCFVGFTDLKTICKAKAITSEKPEIWKVDKVFISKEISLFDNVKWLIAMALDNNGIMFIKEQ